MIKLEAWMKKHAIVFADGTPGVISKMQTNEINGTMYVYYIWVAIEGKIKGPYHPSEISEFI